MSDYTKTTNFTAKDALSTGDPDKLILGALFDTEFDALATAIATKHDSGDIASLAEAQAGSDNTKVMTPLRVDGWSTQNLGLVKDLSDISSDPGVDSFLYYDKTDDTLKFTSFQQSTFTPTIQDTSRSDSEGQTYNSQVGVYQRVGNLVHFWIELRISSLGTLTAGSAAIIGNLPFTPETFSHSYYAANAGFATNLSVTAGQSVTGVVPVGTPEIQLQLWDSTSGATALLISELTSISRIYISGSYIAE